jgi:hypothetical protein
MPVEEFLLLRVMELFYCALKSKIVKKDYRPHLNKLYF